MFKWILSILVVFSSANVFALTETRTAKIFDLKNKTTEPLYTQKINIDRENASTYSTDSVIVDKDGKLMMTEKVVIRDGKLVSQVVEQLQTQEAWELRVENNTATYQNFKIVNSQKVESGKKQSEKIEGNFLNGPLVEYFIAQNWEALEKGQKLETRFSVLEVSQTVAFDFLKSKQQIAADTLTVEMHPHSFFIRLMVDPIFMQFAKDTKKLVHFKGRTPLKTNIKGSWKPFDAEIIYQ